SVALEWGGAAEAMSCALGASGAGAGAAALPAGVAGRIAADELGGAAVTALRLEGFSPSVDERKRTLETLMKAFGELATAEAPRSRAVWEAVRDVTPLAADRSNLSARPDQP